MSCLSTLHDADVGELQVPRVSHAGGFEALCPLSDVSLYAIAALAD